MSVAPGKDSAWEGWELQGAAVLPRSYKPSIVGAGVCSGRAREWARWGRGWARGCRKPGMWHWGSLLKGVVVEGEGLEQAVV